MATARKTAPSTATEAKTRKPRRATVKASDLDFTVVDAAAPVPAEARTRKDRDNPFDAVLTASYEANDEGADLARAVIVPVSQVEATSALIRNAANHLNIGARIFKAEDMGNGTVTLRFRAQKRRVRANKAE